MPVDMNRAMKLFLFVLFVSSQAFATPQTTVVRDKALSFAYGDIADYQMGSEWGKKQVRTSTLDGASNAFVRAAYATAYLPVGGTGFYLGKFGGAHVIATNHHVCPTAADCVGDQAQFRLLAKQYKITKLLITMANVDLSLIEIEVPAADEATLSKVGRNFSFKKDVYQGEPLLTIGFGIGGNPNNYMMANQDSDCVVYSKSGEYRHMADPDDLNPADYRAWSFAHACDISHGDSGSAMVDRNTGEVMGIVWTGRIPKKKKVQDSNFLKRLLATPNDADVWGELSYAVPAVKIAEYLRDAADRSATDARTRGIFNSMLSSKK
jgi:hypothetical protein